MYRYLRYFDYYLETLAKRLSGRGKMNPNTNGEFAVLTNILRNSSEPICFIDGGANIGTHSAYFISQCEILKKENYSLFAIEPFPEIQNVLKNQLSNDKCKLIDAALGDTLGTIQFYFSSSNLIGGSHSAIQHYYLDNKLEVKQITLDSLIQSNNIKKVDFLKLDIEGFEYKALMGAKESLSNGLINYIQLEYNQTWIEAGGSIKKILNLCDEFNYKLYRINSTQLLSIEKYDFNIDDFSYSNLLMVKSGLSLPLPCKRKAIPLV